MNTSDTTIHNEIKKFQPLVNDGVLSAEALLTACTAAAFRNIPAAKVLRFEYHIPRRKLLETLGAYYDCKWIEYDERLPVPPELLAGLDSARLYARQWIPVIIDGDTVIIAAASPRDPATIKEAQLFFPDRPYEIRLALTEDVSAFLSDFLNSPPDHLIGNERTGLAYWRNTMARWRTRLACYRTDFAMAKTRLSLLRGGLTLITIGNILVNTAVRESHGLAMFYWTLIIAGFGIVIYGGAGYFKIKSAILSPPHHQTLVEVTAANLYFFENYQFIDNKPKDVSPKHTMLARIADSLPNNCVFIDSSHDNKVRSHMAHERTTLAAQRTILSCYRTIYARARTGLAFIRTGVSFTSIGLGLIQYFGMNLLTAFDCFLIIAGLLMAVDGMIWYWPVRKEHEESAKCAMME